MEIDEAKKIWADVRINEKKLSLCEGHEFIANENEPAWKQKYKCKHCGGTVDYNAKYWYERGKYHASQNLITAEKADPDYTEYMDVDIEGIPRDKAMQVAKAVGTILGWLDVDFEYGGTADGFTDKVCGISFEVKRGEEE